MTSLKKTTSCISTNESYYGTDFNDDGVKLVVVKDTTTKKVKRYCFFNRKGTTSLFRDVLYRK